MATTRSENAEIAVLQSQMEDVKSSVGSIEGKVDKLLDRFESTSSSFITKSEFESFKKNRWLENTLSAAAGVILMGLIFYFISKGHFSG